MKFGPCTTAALAFALLSQVQAEPAMATEVYEAAGLRGKVWTRTATGVEWTQVRAGDLLEENQLIQVTSGASLNMHLKTSEQGKGEEDEAGLVITVPMIFRLSRHVLRKSSVTKQMITEVPQDTGAGGQDGGKSVLSPLKISEAWHRFAAAIAVGGPEVKTEQRNLAQLEKDGMAMSMKGRPIKLISPAINSIIVSNKTPVEIDLVWTHVAQGTQKYKVYFWRTDQKRPDPIDITTADHYRIRATSSGSFFVQVATIDGGWESPATPVHIDLDKTKGTESPNSQVKKGQGVADTNTTKRKLSGDSPPNHYSVSTPDKVAQVNFHWHFLEPTVPVSQVLFLLKPSGEETARFNVVGLHAEHLPIPPGSYQWTVEATVKDHGQVYNLRSEARLIEVKAQAGRLTSELVKEILKPHTSGVFYFENGL